MRPAGAAAVLAGLVLVTAGCSAVAERATESALGRVSDGQLDVDLDEGSFSVAGEDGESFSVGTTSQVPEAIAAVAPIPDGFRPVSSVETTENDQQATTVSGAVDTADPVGLVDDLEGQLTADGWERTAHSNQNDQFVVVNLTRGEESLNITVMADEAEAVLSLVYLRPA